MPLFNDPLALIFHVGESWIVRIPVNDITTYKIESDGRVLLCTKQPHGNPGRHSFVVNGDDALQFLELLNTLRVVSTPK